MCKAVYFQKLFLYNQGVLKVMYTWKLKEVESSHLFPIRLPCCCAQ